MSVRGEAHIALEGVGPVLYGSHIGGQGVFGRVLRRASMGHDLDPVLSHRVMVPSSVRGRPATVRHVRDKGERTDAQVLLTVA
ncbi:hypothetical protein SSP531S_24350 [Streptomyces spongiicola]|uniref:Uncharacterized protein n=1 Tax=Streptomyces spongiicola TaxID=1690221 RepID=A0A388SWI6_9ACTN|nr:hypothetical protein SSP531S_24350 [Streptomyces spongiicola]